MCGNADDADDITQVTFIQAFRNICGFRGECGIYTWLYSITKNLCLRFLENRKKGTFASLDSLVNSAIMEGDENQYTSFEKKYYINQVKEGCLRGLLRCLPFYQRLSFILHVLLDVGIKDVAVILDKSETAARLLVHRAKRGIKDFLCKNCSLYCKENPCHCENMIGFSLKRGWIQKSPDLSMISAQDIEKEIGQLENLMSLYKSLEERKPPKEITELIREEIKKSSSPIFSLIK
jgi:RNA polymerase sigma-70 factor (ECF subfamily)